MYDTTKLKHLASRFGAFVDSRQILIYMLIPDWVNSLCDAGSLFRIHQSWPGLPEVRCFFASESVRNLILGRTTNQQEAKRAYELRAEIDWFIDGRTFILRPDGAEGTRAWMARLYPSSDEIWEIRSMKPRPSIRIFGSIVALDMFVALTWAKRSGLRGRESEEWKTAITEYKRERANYFGTDQPISGSYPDAYLSNVRLI